MPRHASTRVKLYSVYYTTSWFTPINLYTFTMVSFYCGSMFVHMLNCHPIASQLSSLYVHIVQDPIDVHH